MGEYDEWTGIAYSSYPQWKNMKRDQWKVYDWSTGLNQSAYFECVSDSTDAPTSTAQVSTTANTGGESAIPTPSPTTEQSIAYRPGILYHTIASVLIVVSTLCCVLHD